jgi:hypothetical protein
LYFPSLAVVSSREDFHLQDRAPAGRTIHPRVNPWNPATGSDGPALWGGRREGSFQARGYRGGTASCFLRLLEIRFL